MSRYMLWTMALMACAGGGGAPMDAGRSDLGAPEVGGADAAVFRPGGSVPFTLGARLHGGATPGQLDRYPADLPVGLMALSFREVTGHPTVNLAREQGGGYFRAVTCVDCTRPIQFFVPYAGRYELRVESAGDYELAVEAAPMPAPQALTVTPCNAVRWSMMGPVTEDVDLDACPAQATAGRVIDGEVLLYTWRAETDQALIWQGAPDPKTTLFDLTTGRPAPWSSDRTPPDRGG